MGLGRLVCLLFVSVTWAFAENAVHLDPYAPLARMPRGFYKHRQLDTSVKRSIVILEDEIAEPYKRAPDDTIVANFFHEGKFWIARVPADAVRSIYFQSEFFPAIVPAAHSQLRFDLEADKPIVLFSQQGPDLPKKRVIHSIIYSAEATPIIDGPAYNVIKGFTPVYGLARRILSMDHKYQEMVIERKHRVKQYRLALPDDALQGLFRRALLRSHLGGLHDTYNTWARSCTTEVFDLIDESMGFHLLNRTAAVLDHLPTNAYYYLKWRRVLDPRPVLDLNEDWLLPPGFVRCKDTLISQPARGANTVP